MNKRNILSILLCLFGYMGISQQMTNDSILVSQKLKQIESQLDSLKKTINSQSKTIDSISKKQSLTELNEKYEKSQSEIREVRHNLYLTHKQIQQSHIVLGTGIGLSAAGIALMVAFPRYFRYSYYNIGYVSPTGYKVGVASTLVGSFLTSIVAPVVRLDAFKYLKRGGKKYAVKKIYIENE